MDSALTLSLVGLSHRTAPVSVRERFVVAQSEIGHMLQSLKETEGVIEAFILSTCNRTEVLTVAAKGCEIVPRVREQLFRDLHESHLYVYRDTQALIHVFRTAAGLESVVLGESEILAQIKKSLDAAREARSLGPVLTPLVQQALHAGKRVRTETSLGHGTLSVARVGVDIAARVFARFEGCHALIIGAGETGLLVARHLKDKRIGRLSFANRTLERAQIAAAEFDGRAFGLDVLPKLLAEADIAVACVEASSTQLDGGHFDNRALKKRERPLLVIDLSVPRAVAAEVSKRDNLLLYDLDDLARVVNENHRERALATEGTAEILVSEMHKFLASRTYASFSPAIAEMHSRFDAVRDDVLDRLAGARSDPAQIELAHELSKRLLNVALEQMKETARSTRSEEALDREYQRFVEHL